MIPMTRPVDGWGIHNHAPIAIAPGTPGRPVDSYSAAMRRSVATMSGPEFNGMDPSAPATYTRPWNPAPGMIAYLNFDGAALQSRTPTQLRRGPQARAPRRLRVG